MTEYIDKKKNIFVDTAQTCNLLCKIIIDYIPNKYCIIENVTNNTGEKKIKYEEGSFINYRDTNYEVGNIFFFSPSRHTIDGEKFDFEINIHHGGEGGLTAHNHYHNDENNTPLRKHFHYHSQQEGEPHHKGLNNSGIRKEVISCVLFNRGDHKGSDTNVFFNQFIHELRKNNNSKNKQNKIKVHSHWNLDQLLPKRKSYFMYEDDDRTFIVFEGIQNIDNGIYDILDAYSIKKDKLKETDSEGKDITSIETLFYRTNVEMITDEQYKKTMRAQIKDLLSIARLNYMKDETVSSKEYISAADKIYEDSAGTGVLSSYHEDEDEAMELSNRWNMWAQGNFNELTPSLILEKYSAGDNEFLSGINFDTDSYDYLSIFENVFRKELNDIFFKHFFNETLDEENNDIFFDEFELIQKLDEQKIPKEYQDLYKLNTIRKNIFLYNKIIAPIGYDRTQLDKFESNPKLKEDDSFPDENPYVLKNKDSDANNTKLDNIFKNLVFIHDKNQIEYFLYVRKRETSYNYKIINSELDDLEKISEDNYNDVKDNIITDADMPIFDNKYVVNYFKILEIGTKIFFDNENISNYEEAKDYNIFLGVYRFFIYMSGRYNSLADKDLISSQQFLFPFRNSSTISSIFSISDNDYMFKPQPSEGKESKFKYFTEKSSHSRGYLVRDTIEYNGLKRGKMPVTSYTSFDEQEIEFTYDFIFNNKYNKFIYQRKPDLRDVFRDMTYILDEKIKLNYQNSEYNLKYKSFLTEGSPSGYTKNRNGSVFADHIGFQRKNKHGIPYQDLEMFLWKKFVGMGLEIEINYYTILLNVLKFCRANDKLNSKVKLLLAKPEMDRTVDNDECQDWLSNEVHYEGELLKFWKKPPIFSKDGKKWTDLKPTEKKYIRDGLIKVNKGATNAFNLKDEDKEEGIIWKRHNKCRNPGNLRAGPWCYTKNPKKRWAYCVRPDYTKYTARIILFVVFLLLGIAAITFVKYIFRFEILSKLVAKLTGAKIATEAAFQASKAVNTLKSNVKALSG